MGTAARCKPGLSHNLGRTSPRHSTSPSGARQVGAARLGHLMGHERRLVGAAIMVHGDDSGLVLPPRIAPYQVVIVPIGRTTGARRAARAQELQREIAAAGIA